jgi:hypothetical protein
MVQFPVHLKKVLWLFCIVSSKEESERLQTNFVFEVNQDIEAAPSFDLIVDACDFTLTGASNAAHPPRPVFPARGFSGRVDHHHVLPHYR